MATEIELKLAIAPEHVERLLRLPLLKPVSRGRALTTHLYSVYYDTPDFALRTLGAALRLRRSGSTWMQTLKTAGRVDAGLHQREEIDTPVAAQLINYQALQQAVPDLPFDNGLPSNLAPVFITDFKRTTRQLQTSTGSSLELCIDRGSISSGTAEVPISEIELELKAGLPQHIVELALELLQHLPLRVEPKSKAQRGYALATGQTPAPVKADPPLLQASMTVTDAFRAIVFACVSHLQANEPGLLEGQDPEYLHQARVALRRLRSAFTVFKQAFPPESLAEQIAELRWLGGLLGPARDWDVFVTETLPQVFETFVDDKALQSVARRATRLRNAANEKARAAVASSRYTSMLLELNRALLRAPWSQSSADPARLREQPLLQFASDLLEHRHRTTLKHGERVDRRDAVGLHQLRIRVKRLRYAAEFFSPLYEKKELRAYLAALTDLQKLLGAVNDAATAQRLIAELRPRRADQSQEALGTLRGWCAAIAHAPLAEFPKMWKRFEDSKRFW